MGRPSKHGINAPRVIDLDILYMGDLIVETDRLTIPHPRTVERQFVLEPLSRVHRRLRLPGMGRTVLELLGGLERGIEAVRELAPDSWERR